MRNKKVARIGLQPEPEVVGQTLNCMAAWTFACVGKLRNAIVFFGVVFFRSRLIKKAS